MQLNLPLLGCRDYLQGATLLGAFLELHPQIESFTFKIRKPIFSNHVEIFKNEPEGCHALFLAPGFQLYTMPLPPVEPLTRLEFDEDAINSALKPRPDGFHLRHSPEPLVSSLISAFKRILLTYYPIPEGAPNFHWAFIGLEARKWGGNGFSPIYIRSTYCKNGVARCECAAENGFDGILYFAWVDFKGQK